ncbi:MAG: hypothetical protein GXP09_02515 [Gammaproteobacteria bacterium]|nr:hypothetical protein [Gammaproteobacteria bacterium]
MKKLFVLMLGAMLSLSMVTASAGKKPVSKDHPFAEHFVVFHLSSGSGFEQKLVLNNAANLRKHWGDKVAIEVVVYGPGLRLLFKENVQAKRIKSLAAEGVTFSACGNTMKKMGRKKGDLISVANQVPAGVVRLVELQEAGWSYIRP